MLKIKGGPTAADVTVVDENDKPIQGIRRVEINIEAQEPVKAVLYMHHIEIDLQMEDENVSKAQ